MMRFITSEAMRREARLIKDVFMIRSSISVDFGR